MGCQDERVVEALGATFVWKRTGWLGQALEIRAGRLHSGSTFDAFVHPERLLVTPYRVALYH